MRIYKTQRCSKCHGVKLMREFAKMPNYTRRKLSTCRACVSARNKELAQKKRDRRRTQLSYKEKSRAIYQKARISGGIVLERCSVTGCNRVNDLHGHHFNYKKPLMVIPLCRTHHQEMHSLWVMREMLYKKLVIELEKKG